MGLISNMLESYCTIQRVTVGRDSVGGVTSDPWRNLLVNVPCCMAEAGPSVQTMYAQRNVFVNVTLTFAQDPHTEVNDRILVTDRTGLTTTLLVQGESASVTGRARLWTVACQRIRAPQ